MGTNRINKLNEQLRTTGEYAPEAECDHHHPIGGRPVRIGIMVGAIAVGAIAPSSIVSVYVQRNNRHPHCQERQPPRPPQHLRYYESLELRTSA